MTEAAHGTVGTSDTRLIVLRGNSASGKSSVAAGLREKFGRNLAIVASRRNEPTADRPVNAHRDRDLGNEHLATAIGNTDGRRAKEIYNCSTNVHAVVSRSSEGLSCA